MTVGPSDHSPSPLQVCRLLEHLPPSNINLDDDFYFTAGAVFRNLVDTTDGVLSYEEIQEAMDEYVAENDLSPSGTPTSARALLATYDPVEQKFSYAGMITVWNMWPMWFYDGYEYSVDFDGNAINGDPFDGEISGNIGRGWLAIERGPGGLWWASCPRKMGMITEGTTFLTGAELY